MRELTSMPNGFYSPSSGADVMNFLVQGNNVLMAGVNGQTFTRDNFVELSNIIINDQNLRTQLYFELWDKIGLTYVASNAYRNQLKMLKKDVLGHGDIVEELALDKIEPMPFNPEINWQMALKNFMPTSATMFHKINRAQVYPLTVNDTLLRRAVQSESTFLEFINQQMELQAMSNEMDEFDYFLDLIKYIATDKSYPIKVTSLSTADDYKDYVALVNTYANNLTFASRDYNMLNFKRATPLNRLVFITTSEISAQMNVFVNAPAYNLEFVKILTERTIIVPELPENCIGLLMDDRLAQIYDVVYATDGNHNGMTRGENYFLHVQQIISASSQFNAIAFFTTAEEPTAITLTSPTANTQLVKGQTYPIVATVDKGYTKLTYDIQGQTDENTQITPYGLLYIGQNEQASVINVTLTTYNGVSTTVSYYVRGNTPVISALYPVNNTSLDKNNSYQLTWEFSSGNGTPTFTISPSSPSTISANGLLTIPSTETAETITVTASIGSSQVQRTYNIIGNESE